MTNIYVGNLPYSVQEDDLIEYFNQWGRADRATLVFDRETGRPRGFGFVEMEDPGAAAKAIAEAHGQEFHGRPLTVNEARPRGSGRSATSNPHASSAAAPSDSHQNYGNSASTDAPRSSPSPSSEPSSNPSAGGGYSNQIYQ